jgi:hypothetical protein
MPAPVHSCAWPRASGLARTKSAHRRRPHGRGLSCARDPCLNREVAIKVLPADRFTDENRRRFVQEAQAASALNHPHIVTIHEIEQADGHDFIVMEYVRGKGLNALVRAGDCRLGRPRIAFADALAAAARALGIGALRPEAGQRDGRRRHRRQGARLRPGQADGAGRGLARRADDDGARGTSAGPAPSSAPCPTCARAGSWRRGGRAERRLQLRRDAARDGHGGPAFARKVHGRHAGCRDRATAEAPDGIEPMIPRDVGRSSSRVGSLRPAGTSRGPTCCWERCGWRHCYRHAARAAARGAPSVSSARNPGQR